MDCRTEFAIDPATPGDVEVTSTDLYSPYTKHELRVTAKLDKTGDPYETVSKMIDHSSANPYATTFTFAYDVVAVTRFEYR